MAERFVVYETGTPRALQDLTTDSEMAASGTNHRKGLVPDPGAVVGIVKYLNENGTFKQPIYSELSGLPLTLYSGDTQMINGTFTATTGGNALTIALKTNDGNDPSASNPVNVIVKNATGFTVLTITSALSFVVSSGSTLGTANNIPFRVWILIFDNAGTPKIGVINTVIGGATPTEIFRLFEGDNVTTVAEGGAGAADSAGVYYADAVITKRFRIIGYIDFSSGQATAGTWITNPDKLTLLGPGVKKSGDVIQEVWTQTGASATGTTLIPLDDTIPQSNEGNEYMTLAITPNSAINILKIMAEVQMANNALSQGLVAALFQDTTANALATCALFQASANFNVLQIINWTMRAGTASSTTFKVRAGGHLAGTTTFNGRSSARLYGGTMNSFIKITEIMA